MNQDPIKQRILNCLAQREYSEYELLQKFIKRYPPERVRTILVELKKTNLINDTRFTEVYIRARQRKGYGPKRICNELILRGITREMIAEHLNITDNNWFIVAQRLLKKHFKDHSLQDVKKIQAKKMRFLYQRGFTQDQIEAALDTSLENLNLDHE